MAQKWEYLLLRCGYELRGFSNTREYYQQIGGNKTKVKDYFIDLDNILRSLGDQGWELATNSGEGSFETYIFKRPKS